MYHQRRPESREIRIGKIPDRLGLNISGTQALRLEYPANYTGRIGLYLFRVASNRISAAIAAGVIAPLLSAAPEYVDAKLCKQCHGRITEDFARTGMGRAFYRPTPRGTVDDFGGGARDFYHDRSDTYYSMVARDGRYYQRRWQIGPDGKPANVEELSVDYVLGSGNHARSYLHRTARGTLIELPLGWYADEKSSGGGKWGMTPGSDSDHPRTRRFISYKCMFCHNAIPRIPAGNEAPGSDPVFSGDLPEGIDCQRCHGPGGNHIRAVANSRSTAQDIRASIVNPARLEFSRRIEICMQCHLETSSGPIPSSIVRFNRGPFSFVPGEPLEAFLLTFDHAPGTGHDGKFEAVSAVYRLRQSKCFVKSPDRLECVTCHDPHRPARGPEARSRYTAACRQCHSAAMDVLIAAGRHPDSADCASCHMPKRRAEDTPGMVMTDHLIQRRPPPGNLVAEFRERPAEAYHGEIVPYYPAMLSPSPANALYRAVAQVGLGNNVEAGLPVLAREITAQKPGESEFYLILGDAWQNAGNARDAVAAYRQAAALEPKSARVLRLLADALHSGDTFQQAIQMAPADPITWYRWGLLDLAAADFTSAAAKIRKAIGLDPTLPDQSRSLAEALAKGGQPDAALAACDDALRTDPYDDAAWDLSARILAEKSRWSEASYAFEKAIRLRPGTASYLYDFALALVRADRFDEALPRAEAAAAADANVAETQELLGGLYSRKGRLSDAARSYRRAVELRPDSAAARLRLGSVLAAQGDLAAAADQLRKAAASSDPAIARQASEALRRIGAAR
jgi:predicted CXXCH cytochrome family protein